MNIKVHVAANSFPMLDSREQTELTKDIRENGVRVPLIFLGDELIDGRNRLKGILACGMNPHDHKVVKTAEEIGNPYKFVWSMNGPRRHLTQSQLSMSAARMANEIKTWDDRVQICTPPTVSEAAAIAGVSKRSVQTAKKVIDNAVPEIIEAVDKGEVTVAAASEVSELPKKEQKKIAAKGPRAVKAAASKKRQEKKDKLKPEPEERKSQFDPDEFDKPGDNSKAIADAQKKLDAIKGSIDKAKDALGPFVRALDNCNSGGQFKPHKQIMGHYKRAYDEVTAAAQTVSAMSAAWTRATK